MFDTIISFAKSDPMLFVGACIVAAGFLAGLVTGLGFDRDESHVRHGR